METSVYKKRYGTQDQNKIVWSKLWDNLGDVPLYVWEDVLHEYMSKLSAIPTAEHKCRNCGGTLKLKSDEHIFICPYCGTAYALGTQMVNDMG